MEDVARAVHLAARAYGSLDAALRLTPRQLAAVAALEHKARSDELREAFIVSRVAEHGQKKDVDRLMKELANGG